MQDKKILSAAYYYIEFLKNGFYDDEILANKEVFDILCK